MVCGVAGREVEGLPVSDCGGRGEGLRDKTILRTRTLGLSRGCADGFKCRVPYHLCAPGHGVKMLERIWGNGRVGHVFGFEGCHGGGSVVWFGLGRRVGCGKGKR